MTAAGVLLSIAALAICAVCRPTRVRCPADRDLRTGIRSDGAFTCWSHPVGDPEWDGTWQRTPDRSVQALDQIHGRLYCTGGSRPIVVDYQTVGCQR